MRRRVRILLNVATVASTLLCLVMAARWWKDGKWSIARIGSRDHLLVASDGSLGFSVSEELPRPPEADTLAWLRNRRKGVLREWKWAGFEWASGELLDVGALTSPSTPAYIRSYAHVRYAVAPAWVVVSLLAVLPVIWACRRASGLLFRPRPGLCRACGYDCRATPDRCPECGMVVEGRSGKQESRIE